MSRCDISIQQALIPQEQKLRGSRVTKEFLQRLMDGCHNFLDIFHLLEPTLKNLSCLLVALLPQIIIVLGLWKILAFILQLQTIYCMITLKDNADGGTTLEHYY
jgi:hypothetical protein